MNVIAGFRKKERERGEEGWGNSWIASRCGNSFCATSRKLCAILILITYIARTWNVGMMYQCLWKLSRVWLTCVIRRVLIEISSMKNREEYRNELIYSHAQFSFLGSLLIYLNSTRERRSRKLRGIYTQMNLFTRNFPFYLKHRWAQIMKIARKTQMNLFTRNFPIFFYTYD